MSGSEQRVLVNELTTLLERIQPKAIEMMVEQFPQFSDEIRKGPDAGPAEANRKYHESRAQLAASLCNELVPAIFEVSEKIISRASSLSAASFIVALLAAIGGAATLGALGMGQEDAARLSGIFTSVVAILNSGLDALSKRYTAAETQKAINLKNAALQLNQIRQELELAVRHQRSITEIAASVAKCNEIARDLNQRKDELRLV